MVEGQHEPLIDRMSFDIVQNKLKSRQRPGQTNEISLFAGLIKMRRVWEVSDGTLHKRKTSPADLLLQDLQCLWKEPLHPAPD